MNRKEIIILEKKYYNFLVLTLSQSNNLSLTFREKINKIDVSIQYGRFYILLLKKLQKNVTGEIRFGL